MTVLYISSLFDKAGKTMLAAGLGKFWQENGKRIGYIKLSGSAQSGPDRDAAFIKELLGLSESVEELTAVVDAASPVIPAAASDQIHAKDIVIIEGLALQFSSAWIKALAAKVLVVHDYGMDLAKALPEYEKLSDYLAGVVLNKVPRSKLDSANLASKTALSAANISFWGGIPEDRILASLSVGNLAEAVQGKIINNAEKSGELIENCILGSSTFERGAAYYNRKANKAVILWGERPGYRKAVMANLQSAALQTSCRCLVISGGGDLVPAVKQKADEKKVPLISAPGSLPDLVNALEKSMPSLKFTQVTKMPRLLEVLRSNIDTAKLLQRLK